MNFVRGQGPKEAMGIGLDSILKEIGGIILREDTETWNHVKRDITTEKWKWDLAGLRSGLEDKELRVTQYDFKNKNVIIGISRGRYTILKNRFQYDGPGEGVEKDLITVLLKIKESFINDPFFIFPTIQKVAARTIGMDIVAVKPMNGPAGKLYYYDSKKANKITQMGKKILKKIKEKFLAKPSNFPHI